MLDQRTSSAVESNISRVRTLLACGIFDPQGARNPLYLSALTKLTIRVNDLVGKAAAAGCPVNFDNDVIKQGDVKDVSSLISFIRNAVCHISSGTHKLDDLNAWLSFCSQVGKGCFAEINGRRFECLYEDDTAFFFGEQRIYLKRHLVRAFEQARASLEPLLWKPARDA
jgi:hypothetical protein